MSYILDALRRADSERERGAIPSLHAQPAPLVPDEEPAPPRVSPRALRAAGLGAIVLLGIALVWTLTRRDPAPAGGVGAGPSLPRAGASPPFSTTPATTPATTSAAAAPALVPTLPPLPPEAHPAPAAAALPKAAPSIDPGSVATRGAPAAAGARAGAAAAAEPGTRAPPAAGRRAAGAAAAVADPTGSEAAAPPRVYAQHELPEEIRRGLPALVVNGSVFSKNAADRFLIINGQIVHEKEIVAPDVVLEQIKLRAAVLSSKGFRFEITY